MLFGFWKIGLYLHSICEKQKIIRDEKNISTQQQKKEKQTWLP